tara:strand:- start:202 stop:417 length:216 start_codon:yes stop_codon:yes gene_type:complete
VYVDGNHNYEHVLKEFKLINEILKDDGYILFDDSYKLNGWGLEPLIKIIRKEFKYKLVSRMPNYLLKKTIS